MKPAPVSVFPPRWAICSAVISLGSLVLPVLAELPPLCTIPERTTALHVGEHTNDWRKGGGIGPFLITTTGLPATDPTRLWISYDEDALYIAGDVSSFALDSSSNQNDAFRAAVTERDGDVWSDDSVELRFETENEGITRKTYYAINSIGTLLDMLLTAKGWEKEWNGDAAFSARKKEGGWEFEMRIPWGDLGGHPGLAGKLRFNALRFDRFRNETASWLYLPDGNFQNPGAMGELSLTRGPFISGITKLELPFSRRKKAELQIGGDASSLWWRSELLQSDEVIAVASGENTSASVLAPECPRPRKKAATGARLQFSVVAGDKVLYRTPRYPYGDFTREIECRAEATAPFTLYLNGKPVAADVKTVAAATLALEEGINIIAVELPAKAAFSATFRDDADWTLDTSTPWRAAEANSPQGRTATVDDSTWAFAEPAKEIPNAITRDGQGTVILRKTILHRTTRLTRRSFENRWQLSRGNGYLFHWDGTNVTNWNGHHPLNDFKLILDLPEEITFLGTSAKAFHSIDGKPVGSTAGARAVTYGWKAIGPVTREGARYRRYQIDRDLPMTLKGGGLSWLDTQVRTQEGVTFGLRAEAATEHSAYLWAEANGGSTVEIPEAQALTVLPEIEGNRPKKVVIAMRTSDAFVKDSTLAEAYARSVAAAGITEYFGSSNTPLPGDLGLRQSYYFNIVDSSAINANVASLIADSLFAKYPEARAINFSGQPENTPCLAYLARHDAPWELLEKEVAAIKERCPSLTHLFWDYEFSPFPGHLPIYPCFSPFGMKTFGEAFNIQGPLTPGIIGDRYRKEWIDFTAGELAAVAKRLRELANKHGLEFTVYSGYQLPFTLENYNIDWKKLGPNIDRAYCGYSDDPEIIEGTKSALGHTPLCGGLLLMGDVIQSNTPAQILRKLLQHPAGVLLWYESGFDARTLSTIAEVSRFAARYERFLQEGTPEPAEDGLAIYRLEEELLVIALNDLTGAPRTLEFTIPEGYRPASNGDSREAPAERMHRFKIPSGSFLSLHLKKK